MARRTLAFVLSGGGARGALQVGALRALLEAGKQPDLLVGTSIGACNAAFMALSGVSLASVDRLAELWRDAATADLLPPHYVWLTLRALVRRVHYSGSEQRVRSFWIDHGFTPDLRFAQVQGVRLILVAADLNTGGTVLYGTSPDDSLFEGMLASSALPPWIGPLRRDDRLLVDGGVLSNLPIEAAFRQGATEIIALDLSDPYGGLANAVGFRPGVMKALAAVQRRQIDLELELAAAYGVPVQHVELCDARGLPPIWDFSHTESLMALGYDITRRALEEQEQAQPPSARTRWWTARDWLARSTSRWNSLGSRRRAA